MKRARLANSGSREPGPHARVRGREAAWVNQSYTMEATEAKSDPRRMRAALSRFGLADFRPGQRDVIDSVLAERDVLCVMPTGSGKSLCYQLPAVVLDGLTLVVSPLIALMKDQVDSLRASGIPAEFINSSLTTTAQHECLDRVRDGSCRLLYVAPERFRSRHFVEVVRGLPLKLFAVDEAHCISEWGHDFRHDYARLGEFRAQLGSPTTIAVTATATPEVQADIVSQLRLRAPQVFVTGFARENLHYAVQDCSSKAEKLAALLKFLRGHEGAGIVYVSTRAACTDVADALEGSINRKVAIYHGRLEADERRQVHEDFMSGRTPVIVATNAFGMGIDKPDVRFVVHYNMPGTIESYYQESGRAGRDGLPSICLLLFHPQDRFIQEYFIESAYPERHVVAQVYEYLRTRDERPVQVTHGELKDILRLQISTEGVGTCERLLEKAGAIERLDPLRNMAIVRISSDLPSLVDLLPQKASKQRRVMQCVESIVGRLRHEPVYFQPAQLAQKVDLPLTSVTRALRELSELEAFDYVPPFRGRAIHVPDRALTFNRLQLDFETLARRKAADFAKLDAMVGYARSHDCRQRQVLAYFGATSITCCRVCDNCEARPGVMIDFGDENCHEPELRKAVRVALSGIARIKGRFGKSLAAAMLAGSRATKVTRWHLHELSTFGLLRFMKQSEINELIDALVDAGLVVQNEIDRFRPVVELTNAGREVMKNDCAGFELSVADPLAAKIRNFFAAESDSPSARSPAPSKVQDGDMVAAAEDDALWTYRLCERGFDVAECAKIRRCSMEAVFADLLAASCLGHDVDMRWLLSDVQRHELLERLNAHGDQPFETISQQLTFPLYLAQWQLLRGRLSPSNVGSLAR